ncbi:MAG: hypothetical protein RAK25_02555 [TACK group archaeon]|nr:hypothetical protein [TACK group archaeon]
MSKSLSLSYSQWAEIALSAILVLLVILLRYAWRIGSLPLVPSIVFLTLIVVLGVPLGWKGPSHKAKQ